ncbi:MAG: hypothetical protein Q9217_007003 [Psora testacea]
MHHAPDDLHTRIQTWAQEAALTEQHQRPFIQSNDLSKNTQLRSPLLPVSVNPSKRKRKRSRNRKEETAIEYKPILGLPTEQSCRKRRKRAQGHHKVTPIAIGIGKMPVSPGKDVRRRTLRSHSKPIGPPREEHISPSGPQSSSTTHSRGRTSASAHLLRELQLEPRSAASPPHPTILSPGPSSSAGLSNADAYSRSSSSPHKKSRSPTKRTLEQRKANANLTMNDLASCSPSVCLLGVREAVSLHGTLPHAVKVLRNKLEDQDGFIPRILQVGCLAFVHMDRYADPGGVQRHYDNLHNTPNKSRGRILDHQYQDIFAASCMEAEFLRETVEQVIESAAWNYRMNVHERQWSLTTISPILNAMVQLRSSKTLRLLNLWVLSLILLSKPNMLSVLIVGVYRESCSIRPTELCPKRQGDFRIEPELQSNAATTTATTTLDTTTSRMIDFAFGLKLSPTDEQTVTGAFKCLDDSERSLNQTLSYPITVPLFLDLELKKTNSDRTPEVQLGVWQAAGLRKRALHKWDTRLPMPGICINGHDWSYFITFPCETDDPSVGSSPMWSVGW